MTTDRTLEQRLLVALSGRGKQRIGQFIENSRASLIPGGPFTYRGSDWPRPVDLFYLSDPDFVQALEAWRIQSEHL